MEENAQKDIYSDIKRGNYRVKNKKRNKDGRRQRRKHLEK